MAVDRVSGSLGWFTGLGEQLENRAEERVGELLQRLQLGVRSVDALAKAVRGPRTDWNPYRPPRGEDLQESILNSEVYEWRSTIPIDSLYIEGKALLPPTAPRLGTPVQIKETKETCLPCVSDELPMDFTLTGTLSADHASVLPCDDVSSMSVMSDVVFINNDALETPPHTSSDEVDALFDRLWANVAVPWLLEQRRATDAAPQALERLPSSKPAPLPAPERPAPTPVRTESQTRQRMSMTSAPPGRHRSVLLQINEPPRHLKDALPLRQTLSINKKAERLPQASPVCRTRDTPHGNRGTTPQKEKTPLVTRRSLLVQAPDQPPVSTSEVEAQVARQPPGVKTKYVGDDWRGRPRSQLKYPALPFTEKRYASPGLRIQNKGI